MRHYKVAVRPYEKVLEKWHEMLIPFLDGLASLYIKHRRFEKARKLLESSLHFHLAHLKEPKSRQRILDLAWVYAMTGDVSTATKLILLDTTAK